MARGLLDRIFGGKEKKSASDAEGADRKSRGPGEASEREVALTPEERQANIEANRRISEMAQRAAEHTQYIGARQVRDVPSLKERFARVRGLWSSAEELYTRMKRPSGDDLIFDATGSMIRQLRRYKEALDAAEAAYQAYELYPKTYRSGGDLEMRADFDAVTRPEREFQARDHVAGSTRLREVMGL